MLEIVLGMSVSKIKKFLLSIKDLKKGDSITFQHKTMNIIFKATK